MINELQKKILTLLLEKYEKSKTYIGENRVKQSFSVKPGKLFPEYESDFTDMAQIIDFEQQITELEQMELVTVKLGSRGISAIFANTEKWDDYYKILNRTDKKSMQAMLFDVYKKYESCNLLSAFGKEQCQRVQNNKTAKFDIERAENILNLCLFLEKNQKDILERELSIAVLNDSKLWEKKYRTPVCKLLYKYGNYGELLQCVEDKRERETIILEEFYVFSNPDYVYLKGNAVLHYEDGREIRFYSDIPQAIPNEVLRCDMSIEVIDKTIMTVENLTSFNRLNLKDTLLVFLSGYHNRTKQKLLTSIAVSNPNLSWFHFGDIDPDGLYIAENLKSKTQIPFQLYKMGINELRQYKEYTKPLEDNDRKKAESLLNLAEYVEMVKYMLENNCKLEQEIISWKMNTENNVIK